MIKVKRIYDEPAKNDGVRILVDRLWPRGMSRDNARIDMWLKEISPSNDLRKRFGHDSDSWDEFRKEYEEELGERLALFRRVIEFLEKDHGTVTFLYAARDEQRNNAVALKLML